MAGGGEEARHGSRVTVTTTSAGGKPQSDWPSKPPQNSQCKCWPHQVTPGYRRKPHTRPGKGHAPTSLQRFVGTKLSRRTFIQYSQIRFWREPKHGPAWGRCCCSGDAVCPVAACCPNDAVSPLHVCCPNGASFWTRGHDTETETYCPGCTVRQCRTAFLCPQ